MKDNLFALVPCRKNGRIIGRTRPHRLLGGKLIPGQRITYHRDSVEYMHERRHGMVLRIDSLGVHVILEPIEKSCAAP